MQINEIDEKAVVTVICITYHHEEVIRDAIESFLNQKTTFKYQIFVGEDKGPDNTAEIVKEYAEKYPDKIVAFLRDENMGAQYNLIDLCQKSKSTYLAFCEGDDYWIDEYKLQKQYDYMEANEDVNVCFALAQIDAPDDWFLNDYFKKDKNGRILIPTSDPLCPDLKEKRNNYYFVNVMGHTSTLFYRWDYNIEIPAWYYEGIIGDHSLFFMQLGEGYAYMIPEVMSKYRRSDVGIYMSNNMDEHFLKTRLEWLRIMSGLIEYFEDNGIKEFPKQGMIEKMRKEINNYIRTAIKCNDEKKIIELIEKYPEQSKEAFSLYTSYYIQNRWMIDLYSWKGKQLVTNNKYFMHFMKPFMRLAGHLFSGYRKLKCAIKNAIVYMIRLIGYWGFSLVPKKKNVWAFSGFMKKNYVDNVKYFFEYVTKNHPEIEAVWFTKDQEVYEELTTLGYNVYKMCSLKGIKKMSRASVAVIDHFVMSDYSPIYGYNHKTKVVQLWHGVGFKSMGDEQKVQNTTVPGVQYSNDILAQPEDNFFMKCSKKIKYFFKAPGRELFEEYYIMACPGQERIEMIADKWSVPEAARVMTGHPRDIVVYEKMEKKKERRNKVLYAPTYRFRADKEKKLVSDCLDYMDKIQKFMEKINGEFVMRLHPHTWRNYEPIIMREIEKYDRIFLDDKLDVYQDILEYSLIISDYSSIALDGALYGIPCLFYIPDYNWFEKNEAGFGVDFLNQTPGPKTSDWQENINEMEKFLCDKNYYKKERERILSYYFDFECNDQNNSERIVDAINKRMGEQKI